MALWIYRCLLAFYPPELRRHYGGQMIEQFTEDWAEAKCGRWGTRAGFWFHLIADWASSVTQSHAGIARQDMASALGSFGRRPFSTAALVLLLGMVIAANTFVFVMAHHLILRTPAFEARGRLVYVARTHPQANTGWGEIPRELADRLRRLSTTVEGVALFNDHPIGQPDLRGRISEATPSVFGSLNLAPAWGRLFLEGEQDTAVLGPRLWEQRYHRLHSAVGSTIRVSGRDFRIVGVLNETRTFPFDADIWVPLPPANKYVGVFGRLKPGVALRTAQTEWADLKRGQGEWPVELAWLRQVNRPAVIDFTLWMSQAAFLVVLLLACADLASFQFGQVLRRQREIAIRIAVGASQGRMLRFLITESVVFALLAGALSMPIAAGLLAGIHSALDYWGVPMLEGWSAARFDGFAATVSFGLTLASGVLAGAIPAWSFVHRPLWPMLSSARGERVPLSKLRLSLLAVQVALAVPILFLALAFLAEGRARLASPTVRYLQSGWKVDLNLSELEPARALDSLEQLTGLIDRRGLTPILASSAPLLTEPDTIQFEAGGRHLAQLLRVNSRFFEIPGIEWRSGRPWAEDEARRNTPTPVVVGEEVARMAGGRRSMVLVNANGRRVQVEIAGVIRHPSLDLYRSLPGPAIFYPYQRGPLFSICLLIQPRAGGQADARTIEEDIHRFFPELKPDVQRYSEGFRGSWEPWQYIMGTLAAGGLLALGLAATGVAAYLTQTFAERRQEVALRFALGSRTRQVWMWVSRPAGLALAAGTIVAAASGALVPLLPDGIAPVPGPAVWAAGAAAIVILWVLWTAASWLSSRRAASEPPAGRLRHP